MSNTGKRLRARVDKRERMERAHKLLLSGTVATVTEALSSSGFSEFGRFSSDYKAMFGERPVDTLNRARALNTPTATETGRGTQAAE